ncbi:transcriptional regulator PpsR [uncultured Thiocystis sp.]|uniref:transcriptional regulator PpsR n=1 Tax=uncultured Thiocystis sp. TaxID=1202134 RepID=UPI0025F74523|nr:transcriptional regulator PpsR [uncultured Thiocystis sp.]
MSPFRAPKESIGVLDADTAAALVEGTADIAVIVDHKGIVSDIAFGSDDLLSDINVDWVGQPWLSTVLPESRANLEALLEESNHQSVTRWRQVNHPSLRGTDIPVQYRALRLGKKGSVVAVGRNLQGMAALQQQLVDAQQALERDYWRFRQVETRYRLLFRMVSEAILIIDAPTQRVVEANPAAGQLLGETPTRVIGRPFPEGFDTESTQAINSLLAGVRAAGRADDVRARLIDSLQEFLVSASLLRQENVTFLLVRLSPLLADTASTAMPEAKARYLRVLENAPDCVVITDADGRILTANSTFLSLAEIATEQQARGESLDRWLGRPGVDLNVLMANLRQHSTVRLFATMLRGEYGSTTEVEISAAAVRNGERPYFGFFIRDVGRRLSTEQPPSPEQTRWLDQLTDRVGRVPLKELVRESTDTIERLCIEAALKLTGDNRASAAELLGLSRQSLYVKIDRYGIAADHTTELHAPDKKIAHKSRPE